MSLVRENPHAPRMGKLYDRFYIRADAVIGRVVDEHRNRIRIVLDGLFYFSTCIPSEIPSLWFISGFT